MRLLSYKRGALAAVLVVMLLASMGAAKASFLVESKPIRDSVFWNEQATYELKVTNNEAYDDTFRIRAPEIFWSVQSRPMHQYFGGVDVKGRSSETVTLLINPIQYIPSGQYKVEVDFESINTGVAQREFLIIEIKPSTQTAKDYMASVGKTVTMPQKTDPRNKVPVKVELINRNPKNITTLEIAAKGNTVQKKTTTQLQPLEQKSVDIELQLDPLTSPQKDTITWTFTANGNALEPDIKQTLEILPYTDMQKEKGDAKEFLKTTYSTTYTNKGNSAASQTVEWKTSIIERLFTNTEPKAYVISKSDGQYFLWSLSLGPQEKATVKVTKSYRPLFVLFTIAVLITALYYIFRSPVKIRKEVTVIGYEEGGISDLKVILHVKNRSRRNYDKIIISDKVPAIAHIVKASEVGSLTPTKTMQTKDGAIIRWELEKLEPSEERVFSYTVKSKLSILGKMRFPHASAKFSYDNKERKTRSNSSTVKE